MTFARPELLLLLAVPILLLVAVWRRRAGLLVLPLDHGVAPRRSELWRRLVDLAESLPGALLALAIVLLAGPQETGAPKTKRVLTNIEFCVDVSGSMTAEFGAGTRYDASMAAINQFLDYRKGDAFGLTFFGIQTLHWVPLTQDVSAFRCAPPFMKPDNLPGWFGGTMIGNALEACLKVLSGREEGDRMVILVTDGYSFDLDDGRDAEIANKLEANGVVVYTVHAAEGSPPEEVATIAAITGGEVFAAGDPHALEVVFQRIDEMQRARVERGAPDTFDRFGPFCLAGLALLSTWLLTAFGLRYTPW